MDEPEPQVPRDPNVITDAHDLVEAAVRAFVDGDAATRQRIVDELGDHARKRR